MIQKLTNKLTNRKKDNKGFTLVELIVVIVILAILAAILIPGLLKWIDEAKDKQYQLEARNVYLAAQAEIAKDYGSTGTDPTASAKDMDATMIGKVNNLAGVTASAITYTMDSTGKISSFKTTFESSDKKTVTMEWTETSHEWKKVANP